MRTVVFNKSLGHRRTWIKGLALLLVVASISVNTLPVSAQGGIQVFGEFQYINILGIQADVSLSNLSSGSGDWSAAPTGAKTPSQNVLIESGLEFHYIGNDNNLHPYGSGVDLNGATSTHIDTGTNLYSGQYYHVFSNNYSGTSWQSVFCTSGGCVGEYALDAGTTTFQALDSGLEERDGNAHGRVDTHNNGRFAEGSDHYDPWCWNVPQSTGTSNQPSACFNAGDSWNDSWTASY